MFPIFCKKNYLKTNVITRDLFTLHNVMLLLHLCINLFYLMPIKHFKHVYILLLLLILIVTHNFLLAFHCFFSCKYTVMLLIVKKKFNTI